MQPVWAKAPAPRGFSAQWGAGAAVALVLSAGAASAQQAMMIRYQCDLHGAPAILTAQVQIIDENGLVRMPDPQRPIGVVGPVGASVIYEGELRSQTAHYRFTGRNAFADFWTTVGFERFRVQFEMLPNGLLKLTANPFGPGPTSYLCAPLR